MKPISNIYSNPYYLKENHKEYTTEAYKSQVLGIKKIKKKRKKRTPLTPEQASQQSKERQAAKEQAHQHCPMELRAKGPHTGLYCAQHGIWIRWISQTDADLIKDLL